MSEIKPSMPLRKVGTDITFRSANDAINFQRMKPEVNTETLSAAKTLLTTDYMSQWLDPGGVDRDVTLPAEASSASLIFIILNTANGVLEDLVIKNDTPTTIATLLPGMTGIFSCDGTNWKWENNIGIKYDAIENKVYINATSPLFPATAGVQEGFYIANKNIVLERDDGEAPQIKIKSDRTDWIGLLTFKDQGDNEQWLIRPNASDAASDPRQFRIIEQHQGSAWYAPFKINPQSPADSFIIGPTKVNIGLPLVMSQTPQTLTGAGAVDVTSAITHIVTDGADALTLADGSEGQEKSIVMKTAVGAGTLTPTNLGNGTTITFDSVGDSAQLLFTNSAWHFMGGTATLA